MSAAKATAITSASTQAATPGNYSLPIGYLRAFVTLLVLAHHSALAYFPFAPPMPKSLVDIPRWWQAFPVIDSHRTMASLLLVSFNDIFFMPLMFLLSGLFVWKSLDRKGTARFVHDRALRLGIPFLAAAAVIAPLAYYPTYLLTGGGGVSGFWQQWRALGNWPAGPAWFVWLLLAFDLVAAGLVLLWPKWGEDLARRLRGALTNPAGLFAAIVLVSAVVYVPATLVFHPLQWTAFGPFTFQTTRLLHYFVYFVIGIALGAYGLEMSALVLDGKLARQWPLWTAAAVFAFGADMAASVLALAPGASRSVAVISSFTWVVSCAASSMAFLALFQRFVKRSNRIFDSLRDNAYGMYLIHYAFVGWLQYLLLNSNYPGMIKLSVVFIGTMLLSWGTTAALRRIPAVRHVI